jgi:hypothetical protein
MREFAWIAAAVVSVWSSSARAVDESAQDFSDPAIACQGEQFDQDMTRFIASGSLGRAGVQLRSLKDRTEVSRSKDRLVCSATFVFDDPKVGPLKFLIVMENRGGHPITHLEVPQDTPGQRP